MTSFVGTHRPYVGVWKRTSIEEPIGTMAPEADQEMLVLWMQSVSGNFIDIRVPPRQGLDNNVRQSKSFAGDITLKGDELTWKRVFDFRPTTGQDVGKNTFLADNIIQEDGVLPGDDYREIWQNICEPMSATGSDIGTDVNDFVAELTITEDGTRGGRVLRRGKFIVVGNHFACMISRGVSTPNTVTLAQSLDISDSAVLQYFAATEPSAVDAAMEEHLLDYVTMVGRVRSSAGEWVIDHSLNHSFEGASLLDRPVRVEAGADTLRLGLGRTCVTAADVAGLLFSKRCHWDHTYGATPDQLFALCADRDVILSKVHYPAGTYCSLVSAAEALRKSRQEQGIGASKQIWVGIVGSPGSGKTTLAAELQKSFSRAGRSCSVVPMDGYHLYKADLEALADPKQALDRRGAPFTFNSKRFVEDLKRAKISGSGTFPSFDHTVGDPKENDIELSSDTEVVIIEGNYLCLPSSTADDGEAEQFWGEVGSLLDMVCYLNYSNEDVILSRLCDRHMRVWNWTKEQAMERVLGNDILNTRLIHAEGWYAI